MDTDVFFRKVALSICGDLNIEKSLHSTLLILNEIMPVSWMAIEHYDPENKGMRTIALANLNEGLFLNAKMEQL